MNTRTWDLASLSDRLQVQAARLRRPLTCVLELTYRCSFRCGMCYVRMEDADAARFGRMRTVEEWMDMAEQLRGAGVLNLVLSGGECTVYPGFSELYERLARMGFRLQIMSNAAAYTEEIRDLFRRYPPYNAAVTLYGGSDETCRAVTGVSGAFTRPVENIRFFQSIGVPVTLNFTVVRQNVLDYPLIGRLSQELGIPYTLITDITDHRYGTDFSEAEKFRLSPAERACVACCSVPDVERAMAEAADVEKELAEFRLPEPPAENTPKQNACIGAYSGCAIGWNGEMQACISLIGWRSVYPFETGFEAAWAQLKAQQEETFRLPAACGVCDMREDCQPNCAARRFEGTGDPRKRDPEICRYVWLTRRIRERTGNAVRPSAMSCE